MAPKLTTSLSLKMTLRTALSLKMTQCPRPALYVHQCLPRVRSLAQKRRREVERTAVLAQRRRQVERTVVLAQQLSRRGHPNSAKSAQPLRFVARLGVGSPAERQGPR